MSKDTPLATALRVLRETRSLTQKQLAEESGIERNTISKYENGWITPSRDKLRALLAALRFNSGQLEQTEGFVAGLRGEQAPAGDLAAGSAAAGPDGRRLEIRQLSEELGRILGLLMERIIGGRATAEAGSATGEAEKAGGHLSHGETPGAGD